MDLPPHKAFSASFYSAFPDPKHDIEDVIADGDQVAVRPGSAERTAAAFVGDPPSGKAVDVGALACSGSGAVK